MNSKRKIAAFPYYGGKYYHLKWLLPLLPKTPVYCEPFGGSAAVLLNREPSSLEIYNDLNGAVVNFFRVLRDKPNDLIDKIKLTPYAREEFKHAITNKNNLELSDTERARLFYVAIRQSFIAHPMCKSVGGWAFDKHPAGNGCKKTGVWINSILKLYDVAERFLRVQIEHDKAISVIKRYDGEDTLFYCDPPYPHDSRKSKNVYLGEMSDEEHKELSEVLHSVKGKVAISSYHCQLMDKLYADWDHINAPIKIAPTSKKPRQEVLWINYTMEKADKKVQRLLNEYY